MHDLDYTLEDIAREAGITTITGKGNYCDFDYILAETDDLEISIRGKRSWREDEEPGIISDLRIETLNKQSNAIVAADFPVYGLPLEEVARRLKTIINTQDQLQGE